MPIKSELHSDSSVSSKTGQPTGSKSSTHKFKSYIEQHVRPLLQSHVSRTQVSVLIDLLAWLEQQRYDFSANRAFQTRPLSNALIATTFHVSERSVRRWMAQLERLGILKRRFRKNIHHAYKNLLNRYQFCGFQQWFRETKTATPDTQSPPNKKDIKNISISSEKVGERFDRVPSFPSCGGVSYDPYWRNLADKHLPSGSGRPCMTMIAEKFRQNLKKYALPFSHPSITTRWIKFCQKAKPVR